MQTRSSWLLPIALGLACGPGSAAEATATATASSTSEPASSTTSGDATTANPTTTPPTTTTPSTPTTVEPTTLDPTTLDPTTLDPTTTTAPTTLATSTGDTEFSTSDTSTGEPLQMLTPLALEVADFDGDGTQDLLVMGLDETAAVAGRLSRGHGDGSFAAAIDAEITGSSAFPVIGRLDGEGGTDVLVASDVDQIAVFHWTGAAFAPWMTFTTDLAPLTHAIADADSDGDDDIAWLWFKAPNFGVSLRRNTGGGFLDPVDTPLGDQAQLGIAPGSLVVGRLDGDAVADALIFEPDQPKGLLRLLGAANGGFGKPAAVLPAVRPWVCALGDFNEDGARDLLLVERTPAHLLLATGDGKGGFAVATTVAVPGPFLPFTIAVADLDGDEHLDVVVVDDKSAELRIWSGDGDGDLSPRNPIPLPSPALRAHAAAFDAGPLLDLAVATFAAGDVTVLLDP